MKTNDLKRGAYIKLSNGWEAEIADNMKGNTRLATVYGEFTETGSVYAHDIIAVRIADEWHPIEHTPAQLKLRQRVSYFGL